MKKTTTLKALLLVFFFLLSIPTIYSQVSKVVFYSEADLCIGDGTGAKLGDAKNMNFGKEGNLILTNFDDNEVYRSGFESWVKFNLSTLQDSIPVGQKILYSEISFKVSGNYGNGYKCYHLKNIDNWKEGNGSSSSLDTEGGLTWTSAQAYNYTDSSNPLINSNYALGSTSYVETFPIQSSVDYELGANGNKILTLRMVPTITAYDPVTNDIKWLGLYSKESPYDVANPGDLSPGSAHITFMIGQEPNKVFSDIENLGNLDNYTTYPLGFQKWAVLNDEGQDRLKITQRPAPVNKTPGGLAIYNNKTFGDFEISLKAKVNKLGTDGIDPKVDFAIPFGYKNMQDYFYFNFTGEGKDGIYKVDAAGATLVGAGNSTAAINDTLYHEYKIVRSATTVTAYVDGVKYLTVTDPSLNAVGSVGMGSYNDIAFFDDFNVKTGGLDAVNSLTQKSLEIYPNPATNNLYVNSEYYISKLVIRNVLGQETLTQNVQKSGIINLNVSSLRKGIYFISLYGAVDFNQTRKFIIK
jgi:hypothetical protein